MLISELSCSIISNVWHENNEKFDSGWIQVKVKVQMSLEFYIHDSVHCNSILIRSNKMQQFAGIYLL